MPRSAGERLTVMRLGGSWKAVFFMAVRTRSLASLTSEPRKPTRAVSGSPEEGSHSTHISTLSMTSSFIA
ncbi:MAG: hypothetical protein ILP12_01505 [Lachnospiraceae bacterium]|nr:hypothetical protein [Lachnospiraceae bacterium]